MSEGEEIDKLTRRGKRNYFKRSYFKDEPKRDEAQDEKSSDQALTTTRVIPDQGEARDEGRDRASTER